MSSELKPAFIAKVAKVMQSANRADRKTFVQHYLTPAGEVTFSIERAATSRDRKKIEALLHGHTGGTVQEWALPDRRINL